MRNFLRLSNLKKTVYYLKKNGFSQTYYAMVERTIEEIKDSYAYQAPTTEELQVQREKTADYDLKLSVVVPIYDPKPAFFCEMVESVLNQSYQHFELILCEAGEDEKIAGLALEYAAKDTRVKYYRLNENKGISGNTNIALQYTTGDYVGLMDHDDLLTPDALYEMASAILASEARDIRLGFLYSDEDKVSADASSFFDYHNKPGLNLDLVLSNNYICHFLVIRRDLIRTLELRSAYDGAQDYDLVLRAIEQLLGKAYGKSAEELCLSVKRAKEAVYHVPKVLYHWRSHRESTAQNPQSKEYAYEAGKRAIEDFIRRRGYNGTVSHTRHLGFYRIDYIPDELSVRPEIGIIGGKLLNGQNKITGGIYEEDGTPLYYGLGKEYSGYMHRALLLQEAMAVDIRCMIISPAVEDIFEEVMGLPYMVSRREGYYDYRSALKPEADCKKLSLELCERVRAAGFLIVWDPKMVVKLS